MKKILCIILSVALLISSLGAFALAVGEDESKPNNGLDINIADFVSDKINAEGFKKALQAYTYNNSDIPDGYKDSKGNYNIDKLLRSENCGGASVFGLSLNNMYNTNISLYWAGLPQASDPYCEHCEKNIDRNIVSGVICPICKNHLTVETIYNTMAIVSGNLNSYLKKIINRLYGGAKLYSSENATKICNFIGSLLYTNYVDKVMSFETPISENRSDDFYDAIAEQSGLKAIVESNWCNNPRLNVKPLLSALGVGLYNFTVIDKEVRDPQLVSRYLIKYIIQEILDKGPIEYALNVISTFSKSYSLTLYEPLRALFNVKVSSGIISEEDLKTVKGFVNLLFNNNNPEDSSKLQFVDLPMRRIANTEDKVELFFYFVIYLNLVGKHSTNPGVVSNLKSKFSSSAVLEDVEKERLLKIVDGLFCGQLDEMGSALAIVSSENISDVKTNFWNSLINMAKNFINKIVSFFDSIYQNLKNIGNLGKK